MSARSEAAWRTRYLICFIRTYPIVNILPVRLTVKVSSYMAQYSALKIAQNSLLLDRPVTSRLPGEASSDTTVNVCRLFIIQISTNVYSQLFIHTAERTGAMSSENNCPWYEAMAHDLSPVS